MECQPAKTRFLRLFHAIFAFNDSQKFPFIDKLNARAHKSAKDVAR
jgi:hypothetical protein